MMTLASTFIQQDRTRIFSPSIRVRSLTIWIVLIWPLMAILSGCGRTENQNQSTEAAAADSYTIPNLSSQFVGSASCSECHSEISATYAQHPMANSLFSAATAPELEDFDESRFETVPGVSYFAEKIDDRVWHHELRHDDGNLVYDHKVPIDYAVGSGTRGRSYLTDVDGRLIQSPITWYSGTSEWGLSPGFVPESHARFERRVTHACLACHAGRVNPHATEPDRFASPPFHENAIGCERCHGPGHDHVAFHRLPTEQRSNVDPIVNPSALSAARQDAVCNQCHLQGQRRVLREGLTEFDFRPGMKLNDLWLTILKTQGVQSGVADAVSQVEQMHASVCFRQSDGKLNCVSCHDPHRFPSKEEAPDFYRAKCLNCHSPNQTECSEQAPIRQQKNDSCVACHMPHFGAADVHSAQTDHRVLIRPIIESDTGPHGSRSDPLTFFEEPDFTIKPADQDRATGIFLAEQSYLHNDQAAARKAVQLLTPGRLNEATDIELLFALSKAYIQLKRQRDAAETLERVLTLQPEHEEALESLATTAHESNRLALARSCYERLLKLNPNRSRYYGRYSHVVGQLKDYQAAIKAGERALELDPSLVQSHEWLAEMYALSGEPEKSAEHREKAQQYLQKSGKPSTKGEQ